MGSFCVSLTGEVITCNCFFDFWFYYVNKENRSTHKKFNDIIKFINSKEIIDYFGYYPQISIKIIGFFTIVILVLF